MSAASGSHSFLPNLCSARGLQDMGGYVFPWPNETFQQRFFCVLLIGQRQGKVNLERKENTKLLFVTASKPENGDIRSPHFTSPRIPKVSILLSTRPHDELLVRFQPQFGQDVRPVYSWLVMLIRVQNVMRKLKYFMVT